MKISAAIPADLLERLVARAREADRSVSAEVRVAIREHVAAETGDAGREPKAR